jgi:hypothetical protein
MPVTVVVTSKRIVSRSFQTWDTACGQAVRDSLKGAEDVVLVDINGLQYHVYAERVEDNS